MFTYSPGAFLGVSEETIAELKKMVEELCGEIKPCPTPTPGPFCDPRDICTMCNGAFTLSSKAGAASLKLASCLSTVNWACCSESDPSVKNCYEFCPMVPEEGFNPATMTKEQLFTLESWWNFRCSSQTASSAVTGSMEPTPTPTSTSGAAFDGIRQQLGQLTSLREQLEQLVRSSASPLAEGASVNLLATSKSLGAMHRVHTAEKVDRTVFALASSLRTKLEHRSCDEQARMHAHALVATFMRGRDKK